MFISDTNVKMTYLPKYKKPSIKDDPPSQSSVFRKTFVLNMFKFVCSCKMTHSSSGCELGTLSPTKIKWPEMLKIVNWQ